MRPVSTNSRWYDVGDKFVYYYRSAGKGDADDRGAPIPRALARAKLAHPIIIGPSPDPLHPDGGLSHFALLLAMIHCVLTRSCYTFEIAN